MSIIIEPLFKMNEQIIDCTISLLSMIIWIRNLTYTSNNQLNLFSAHEATSAKLNNLGIQSLAFALSFDKQFLGW